MVMIKYKIKSKLTCRFILLTGNDYEVDVALRGHSYKNLTASNLKECLATCLNECRCMSYQLFGTRCELLDEDRNTAPADFVPTPGYKYSKPKPTLTQVNDMYIQCSSRDHCPPCWIPRTR